MDRIKNWFRSLGSKAQSFMYGRYGYDELTQFLFRTAILCNRTYQQLYRQYRRAEQTYETNAQGFDMGAMQIQKVCMGLCLAQMFCNPYGCLRCI